MAACREQGLREKEVREHREEAQEEDDEDVAAGAQFQGLERQHQDDERDAGVASQHRAMRRQGGSQAQSQQAEDPPAARQGAWSSPRASRARPDSTP
jgi:hypothetical protein